MKSSYIINNRHRRLLLLWAGWGMDCRPFEPLRDVLQDTDCCICYDYTTAPCTSDMEQWKRYDEIELYAWSLGVWAASQWLTWDTLPIVRATAINGTPHGISDSCGISCAVFDATLAGLSEVTYEKFLRRMCGDSTTLETFKTMRPCRSMVDLQEELQTIGEAVSDRAMRRGRWSRAIVGRRDHIFTPEAQLQAWSELQVPVIEEDIAHYAPMARLIANDLIDKQRVARHFGRAIESYNKAAVVQNGMAQRLMELLPTHCAAQNILEIGCGTGLLTRRLVEKFSRAQFTLNDLCPAMGETIASIAGSSATFIGGDAEQAVFPGTYDLIASAATIQWFGNLPRFAARIEQQLATGGVVLMSTFGSRNLMELRSITHKGLPYYAASTLRTIFEQYYRDVEVIEEEHTLTFDTPLDVLRHLQQTGANGIASGDFSPRKFASLYNMRYADSEGRVPLTYNPIYIIAHKKETL